MSYMTLSSQEKPLFQKRIPLSRLFLLCSYFRAHLTTLILKILGDGWAVLPPQIFVGNRPPSPSRSPPLDPGLEAEVGLLNLDFIDTSSSSSHYNSRSLT